MADSDVNYAENLVTYKHDESDIYYRTEHEFQSHTLAMDENEDSNYMYRPSLADKVKVGFFSLDHASQTEVTDIVDLKEMTTVIQTLLQDVANLKKDINSTKHAMQADHDTKLQTKSMELYCRINEKVVDLERIHQARIICLRKAFHQQLADTVAKLSVHFDKNLQSKMVRERTKQRSDLASKDEKFREMQSTILRNEGVIQMLQDQLRQYQINQQDEDDDVEDRFIDRKFSVDEGSQQADSDLQERLTADQEELAKVIEQLEKCGKTISGLEEVLNVKDEEIQSLNKDIDSVKEQLQRSDIMVEKLKTEQKEMADNAAREKETAKKMLGRQNDEMKRLLDEQVKLARAEAVNKMKLEAQKAASQDQDKIKHMTNQIAELEKQLSKGKEKSGTVAQVSSSSKTVADEKLTAEIQRLQADLEKAHRTWEKKYTILQQSMHALKDESYLRQTLQRQSAQLHQAALSYSSDLPTGLLPAKTPSSGMKKPLPHIQQLNKGQGPNGDYIAYTFSAPIGRGTSMCFPDDQIMTDNEIDMMPEDIELLPSPIIRGYNNGTHRHIYQHADPRVFT